MIQQAFNFLATIYSRKIDKLEEKIGYRFRFTNIPAAWINGCMRFDMGNSLAKHNIHAWCIDYFTMGSLTPTGVSSRYVRNEKQYQSWLGAYLVRFKDERNFTIQDHFDLASADQKNWLHDFGDPSPFCEITAGNFVESGQISVGKYSGTLYEDLGSSSHSDVGNLSNNLRNRFLMGFMTAMFNKTNRELDLKGSNFLPKDIHSEYETVNLRGYIAIINLGRNVSLVLYSNGVGDYTLLLKEDILKAFEEAKVEKI